LYIKKLLAASAASLFLCAPANAASITIADGETWCDSADKLVSTASCSNPLSTEDLGQTAAADSVTFLGAGTIIGFVQDGPGLNNKWADAAMVTLSQASKIKFSLIAPTDTAFDGSLSFGGTVSVLHFRLRCLNWMPAPMHFRLMRPRQTNGLPTHPNTGSKWPQFHFQPPGF
jgi:hypothetical protein